MQRAILLKYIALDGHIMRFNVEPTLEPGQQMQIEARLKGINKATTFFGFCSRHDSELFRPLEASDFAFEPEQIALLGYRAICRDFYGKEAEIAFNDEALFYLATNRDIPGFGEKNFVYRIKRVAMLNARKNYSRARTAFARMVQTRDFADLRYFGLRFDAPPVYVASAAVLPEWDFNGEKLQDLNTLDDFYPICFAAWAAAGMSAVVFCWHASADHICRPFVDSLREARPRRFADLILSMAFEYSENIAFRPDWWQALPDRYKRALGSRVMSGVDDATRTARSLLDDDLRALRSAVTASYVGY